MAIFDKSYFKTINDHFEEIGYPIKNFDNKQEKKFVSESGYSDRYYEKTNDLNLVDFYTIPIICEGAELGDKFQIYFKSGYKWGSIRALENVKYDPLTKMLITTINPEYLFIKKIKDGGKYIGDSSEFLSEQMLSTQSELLSLENFDDINAPDYSVLLGDNPQVSQASKKQNVEGLTDIQFKKAQEKLEKCKQELKDTLLANENGTLSTAMWTFDEVDEIYNSQIEVDDKRAFCIWLQNKNRKKLVGEMYDKYGTSYPAPATDIIELMKKGCLFFDGTAPFGERLQPKVIYQSGNIWRKWSALTNKKDYVVQRFGEEIYNIHYETLKDIYIKIFDDRLRVGGEDKSVRATILPTSDLAENIKIESVVNPRDRAEIEENFRIYTSWKEGKRIEDISGYRMEGKSRNNYINKKTLSLYEGFIRWCAMAGSGLQAQEVGVQWSNITTNIGQLEDYYLKPIDNPFSKEKGGEEKWARYQDDARKVGNRLFAQFLSEGLTPKDQTKVEVVFNSTYNSYTEPNLDQVPIGFTYKKYLDNRHLFILSKSNLNAIKNYLTKGSIGLAYGVGLGKTFCSIFVMKQVLDLGIAKRPLVIVPNQVYYQFSQEIQRGLGSEFNPTIPNTRLNMFYNASGIYNEFGNNAVDGINLCTYEATETFAFDINYLQIDDQNRPTDQWLINAINVLEMGGDGAVSNPAILDGFLKEHSKSILNIEVDIDKSENLNIENEDIIDDSQQQENEDDDLDLGEFKSGGEINDEESLNPKKGEFLFLNTPKTNFDFICVDEAHNFNNLFSSVVSSPKEVQGGEPSKKTGKIRIRRERNPYTSIKETAGGRGDGSARAKKLWWLSKFVQSKSAMGNTLLLSATPFTNSPLQLFTMLAYLNYEMLEEAQIGIIKDFFDLFAKIEYAEDFKTDLSIVKRNKLIGWNNVIAMQKFVYRVFDKSSREDEDKAVIRPNKIVLPLKRMLVNNKVYDFAKENFVSTTIKLSQLQQTLWNRVRDYAGGKINPATGNPYKYEDICNPSTYNTTSLGKYIVKKKEKIEEEEGSAEVDVENVDDLSDGTIQGEKAKESAKALQCLAWGRQICLNPYLFKCSGLTNEPTGKDYIEASPKLLYVMNCIKSVKEYHEKNSDSPLMSGQVIYMNFGVGAFGLIRNYLVEELGFSMNEIGIISGKGNYIGKKRFENKQKVADAFLGRILDAETGKYSQLEDSKRIKVLIGSEAIKEGINLQEYASVLYNCYLDFNPTDLVQVEGRIWRQGNAFANVRIVTPLMSDCIDVFMFQKLEDKTERINQIWTRNGQLNELDTTAFNPADLKYELLSDPFSIAVLEREYRKDILEQNKIAESEILSRYIGLLDVWNKGEKILYPIVNPRPQNDFRNMVYWKISQIRPDLIEKPLWNQEEWNKFLQLSFNQYASQGQNSRYPSINEVYKDFKTPNDWALNSNYLCKYSDDWKNWEQQQKVNDPLYKEWINKIYLYSVEELINLMTKVFKEQKIAYPRGYASNWRELLPKKQVPIVEGDEVMFETKKGDKKRGIAESVVDNYGNLILSNFYYQLAYQTRNNETDKKNFEDAIQKLKLKNVDVSKNDFDTLDETSKKELATLLKYYYKENPNYILGAGEEFTANLIPIALDVDSSEDLNIIEKKIVRISKKEEGEEKEVKPNKYPDPVSYSNKDIIKVVEEIRDYQAGWNIKMLEIGIKDGTKLNNDSDNNAVIVMSLPPEKQYPLFGYYFNDIISIILNSSNTNNLNDWKTTFTNDTSYSYRSVQSNLPKTWIDFEEAQNNKSSGLFHSRSTRIYDFNIPRDLAEFQKTKEKQFIPLGINTNSDIQNMVDSQKEKINSIEIEKRFLDDSQVFQELVQEVERRQAELNSEEIRAGSSYLARAELFANPNPDYIGNNMLSIFQNTNEELLKQIDIKFRPSERAIENARRIREQLQLGEIEQKSKLDKTKKKSKIISEEPLPTTKVEPKEERKEEEVIVKRTSQEIIDELSALMEFESPKEKKKTKQIIAELKMLMEFE